MEILERSRKDGAQMAKKVYELAKELDLTSKEIIEKLNQMGVSVTSHMSALDDDIVAKIQNAKGMKDGETTIVKVQPKSVKKNVEDTPRVVVQAAAVTPVTSAKSSDKEDYKADKSMKTVKTDKISKPDDSAVTIEKLQEEAPKRRVFRVNIDAEKGKETVEIPKEMMGAKEKKSEKQTPRSEEHHV